MSDCDAGEEDRGMHGSFASLRMTALGNIRSREEGQLHLRHIAAGFELLAEVGGDLLPVKAPVFDEDLAGA